MFFYQKLILIFNIGNCFINYITREIINMYVIILTTLTSAILKLYQDIYSGVTSSLYKLVQNMYCFLTEAKTTLIAFINMCASMWKVSYIIVSNFKFLIQKMYDFFNYLYTLLETLVRLRRIVLI